MADQNRAPTLFTTDNTDIGDGDSGADDIGSSRPGPPPTLFGDATAGHDRG